MRITKYFCSDFFIKNGTPELTHLLRGGTRIGLIPGHRQNMTCTLFAQPTSATDKITVPSLFHKGIKLYRWRFRIRSNRCKGRELLAKACFGKSFAMPTAPIPRRHSAGFSQLLTFELHWHFSRIEAIPNRMEKIRIAIERHGLVSFKAADLADTDLETMAWSGDALHIDLMREQMNDKRICSDTVAIYPPHTPPVSKGYVVHARHRNESTISQLATHPGLQSLGLGSLLLNAIEERIRKQGVTKAVLGVETSNPRARKLYEKLGYVYFKTDVDSWEAVDSDGNTYTHQTYVDWLSKIL